MKLPTSRSEAKRLGARLYFTGLPCRHGHVASRKTDKGICVGCINMHARHTRMQKASDKTWRETRRQYDREDYTRHKDKRLKKARTQYRQNRNEILSRLKQTYESKKEEILQKKKNIYWKDPTTARQQNRAWRHRNRDKILARERELYRQNPERKRTHNRNRQAKVGRHDPSDIKRLMTLQRGRCAYCRIRLMDKYHVDHIYPSVRGGSNDPRNLQILCVSCNCSKWSRDPIEFAQSLGLLL